MSEFDIDWDLEDGPQVDPPVYGDGSASFADPFGLVSDVADPGTDGDGPAFDPAFDFEVFDEGDGPVGLDDFVEETEYPELAHEVVEGAFELLGADPDEEALWDQIMLDLNEDVNPYASAP